MENIYSTIIRPLFTEKVMRAQEPDTKKYTFLVYNYNKITIKQAVEKLYNTTVEAVNITPVRKKQRKAGKTVITTRPAGKKAIITLKKGLSIDVMNISLEQDKVKNEKKVLNKVKKQDKRDEKK